MLRRFYYLGFLGAGLCITTWAGAASKQRRAGEDQASRQSAVVVIDAGHGGFDRGGIPGQRIAEKTMTLDVALRLQKVLQDAGYRVVMTRESDVFVPLGTRVAIANSYPNGILVCIHFNAARRSGASGIETYFYSRDSLTLASAVHYNVAGGAPSSNRGVRRRGYFVLRRTRIPAVLVELGFLTNPTEARYVQNSSYRQKLAEEIARGIGGRNSVRASSLGTNIPSIPLQPFIDQTLVRDRDVSRSKRSRKSARRRSTKSSGSEKKQSSDDESATGKKSTSKPTEN
jgi:N-acetylmuramoyl-L-alanine amidase